MGAVACHAGDQRYHQNDKIPKRWKNLVNQKYITCFKYCYPSIPSILKQQYGLKDDGRKIVYIMREICLLHFKRYRTQFKKVFSGRLKDYKIYLRKFLRNRSKISNS